MRTEQSLEVFLKSLPVCQGPPSADTELCSHKFVTFGPGDALAASLVLPYGFLAWVTCFLSRWGAGWKVMWNFKLFLCWLLLAIPRIPLPLWWMEKLSSRKRIGGWRAAVVVLPLLLFTIQVPFRRSLKLPFLFCTHLFSFPSKVSLSLMPAKSGLNPSLSQ